MKRLLAIAIMCLILFPYQSYADTVCVRREKRHRVLPAQHTVLKSFKCRMTITEPSYLIISGHIDVEHLGKGGRIMVAFRVRVNGTNLKGSFTGQNILSEKDHYYSAQIHGAATLAPGVYVFKIVGRSTDMTGRYGGVAAIKPNYNVVIYRIIPKEDGG